jgi:hypothetical protein
MQKSDNLNLVAAMLSMETCKEHQVHATVKINEHSNLDFTNICCYNLFKQLELKFVELINEYPI